MKRCFKRIRKILSVFGSEKGHLKNKTILIVEDNKCDQELISKLIIKAGGKTVIANDGETGIKIAYDIMPDLIVLDYFLPGENGPKICQKLKDNTETKEIPILFLTVNQSEDDMVICLDAGANGYIMKPIDSKIVISEIKYTIQNPYI